MKVEFFLRSSEGDVMLKIDQAMEIHRIVLARHELQELKVAIEDYQGKQPFRVAKEATGGKSGK